MDTRAIEDRIHNTNNLGIKAKTNKQLGGILWRLWDRLVRKCWLNFNLAIGTTGDKKLELSSADPANESAHCDDTTGSPKRDGQGVAIMARL